MNDPNAEDQPKNAPTSLETPAKGNPEPNAEAPKEIVIEPSREAQPNYFLGRLGGHDPKAAIKEAVDIANALAEIVTAQKLYTVIKGKKYVWFEGWSIIGGMMGVVPVEEYVKEIPQGYEAKIQLVRMRDKAIVGAASSICTRQGQWEKADEYAVRSMAITRAASKAYRLTYGWIIKLAGFDPTPVEEANVIAQVEAEQRYQEREDAELKSITLVRWKNGNLALQGIGVSVFRAALSDGSRKALDIKLDEADKVHYIKAALAFELQDIAKKHGYTVTFADDRT
jgi:hypothetical protein